MHPDSLQRSCSARTGVVVTSGCGLHRRADPGQGRQHAHGRIPAGRRRAVPQIWIAAHRRRNPDRDRPHRKIPRGRALERRARHVLLAKALSGGHVPVGAVLTRKNIFDKIFNQMDRAVVHGSTFAKNDLAMAAGIATLEVIKEERLVEQAARRGAELRLALTRMVPGYELMKEVRGKGLMIGVEFGPPKSLRLKASWNLLETANKGLFCQLITVPLFKDQKILTQVSGHGSHTIKLLPPLTITQEDCDWIERAFDTVIAGSHKVPGAIWSLGKTLVDNAVRKSA